MTATLYAIPGSHAVRTGELMLEHKGIPFRRVNFPAGPHRLLVRLRGFRGDRVYLRHAKAGELCERFATLHLVRGSEIVDEVPTYRGEGRTEL